MNEQITIVIGDGSAIVELGRRPSSRWMWYAPGLEIYVHGKMSMMPDIIANLACHEAISRHIPLVSLRLVTSDMKLTRGAGS